MAEAVAAAVAATAVTSPATPGAIDRECDRMNPGQRDGRFRRECALGIIPESGPHCQFAGSLHVWFSISSALRVDRKFNHPVAQRSQPSAAAGGRALPLCCQRRRHTVPAEPPNGLTRAAPDTCASATRGREGGRPQPPPRLGQLTAASRRAPAGASHPAVRWRRRGGSPLRAPRGACMMTRCLVVVYRALIKE